MARRCWSLVASCCLTASYRWFSVASVLASSSSFLSWAARRVSNSNVWPVSRSAWASSNFCRLANSDCNCACVCWLAASSVSKAVRSWRRLAACCSAVSQRPVCADKDSVNSLIFSSTSGRSAGGSASVTGSASDSACCFASNCSHASSICLTMTACFFSFSAKAISNSARLPGLAEAACWTNFALSFWVAARAASRSPIKRAQSAACSSVVREAGMVGAAGEAAVRVAGASPAVGTDGVAEGSATRAGSVGFANRRNGAAGSAGRGSAAGGWAVAIGGRVLARAAGGKSGFCGEEAWSGSGGVLSGLVTLAVWGCSR